MKKIRILSYAPWWVAASNASQMNNLPTEHARHCSASRQPAFEEGSWSTFARFARLRRWLVARPPQPFSLRLQG